jgi:hypothetical protein
MAAIAELYVQVGAKIDGLMSGLNDVDRRMRETSAGIDAAAGSAGGLRDIFLGGLGAELVAGALSSAMGAVSDFVGSALDHLGEVEQINAQTAAAIASTGGAAGVTAEQVSALANSIEAATGVSGEMIQQGENLLLTFTNLKNRAGEGNDIFNQTTNIMADMSAALGTDAKGAALQLGKALNDPIQGVSALTRVGVSFTEGQKASIKAMQEHGNIAGAQKLILAELNKEFGGSANAFGKTWPGILEKAGAAWENFGDALLGPLMPAFKAGMATMADTVNQLADAIGTDGLLKTIGSAFGPTTLALIAGVGAAIAVHVTPAIIAAGIAAATSLPAIAAGFIAGATAAAPLIATAAAVAFAVRPILQNWGQIPGAFSAYMSLAESTILSWYQTAREVAIKAGDAFRAVAANIASYFNKVFGGLGQELQAQWNNLPEAVRGPLSGIAGAFKGMAVEVGGAVATIPGMVAGHVKRVAGAAYDLAAPIGNEFLAVGQIAKTYLGDLGAYINSFGAAAVKSFGKIGDDAGEAHAAGHKKGGKKAVGEAEKAAKAIEKAYGDLGKKLGQTGESIQRAIQLGDLEGQIKAVTAGGNLLAGTLKTLAQNGGAGTAQFKALQVELEGVVDWLDTLKARQAEVNNTAKALATYRASYDGLASSLSSIAIEADAIGPSFDRVGAEAEALKKHLGELVDLRKGGALISPIEIKAAAAAFDVATRAAKEFQAELADRRALSDLEEKLAEIDRRALVLGPSFDRAGARAAAMRSTLDAVAGSSSLAGAELADLKLKTEAADLAAATAAQGGLAGFNTAISNVHQSLGGLGGGLVTFLDALGVQLPPVITTAASNLGQLAGGFNQLAANAPGAMSALGQFGTIAASIPIPLGAIGLALGFLALSTVTTAEKFNQSGAMIGASMDKAGMAVTDSSKVMIRSLANVSAAADLTRAQLDWEKKGGIRPGNPAAFQKLFNDLDRAKRETEKFIDLFGNLTSNLKGSFSSALGGALKGFLDGSKGMAEGLRTGIRDAIIGGIVEATLQKGLIEKSFGGLIERLAGELAKGDSWSLNSADKIISEIGAKVPQVAATLETVFGRLKGTLDKAFDPTAGIMDTRGKAYADAQFQSGTLGSLDAAGLLKAKVSADEKALEALRTAGISQGGAFADLMATLTKNRADLAAAEAATKATKDTGKKDVSDAAKAIEAQQKAIREAYQGQLDAIGSKLQQVTNDSAAGQQLIAQLNASRAAMDAALAAVATSLPTSSGSGGTFDSIAAGVSRYRADGGGTVNNVAVELVYQGSGSMGRADASATLDVLVSEMKRRGIRVG